MNLVLWRHAEAEDTSPDLTRALTAAGRRSAARIARVLAAQLPSDAHVLVSPATRAVQTAEALVRKSKLHYDIEPRLQPGAALSEVLAAIEDGMHANGAETPWLVVVGHQPWIGQIARRLLANSDGDWSVRKAAAWWLVRRARGGDAAWTLRTVFDPDLV